MITDLEHGRLLLATPDRYRVSASAASAVIESGDHWVLQQAAALPQPVLDYTVRDIGTGRAVATDVAIVQCTEEFERVRARYRLGTQLAPVGRAVAALAAVLAIGAFLAEAYLAPQADGVLIATAVLRLSFIAVGVSITSPRRRDDQHREQRGSSARQSAWALIHRSGDPGLRRQAQR